MFDDFTIWRIKPWEEKHKLVLDAEPTAAADAIVLMSFNQPAMASADMLTVAKVTGENENINQSSYSLKNSYVDKNTKFNEIKEEGTYHYFVDAIAK